MKASSVVAGTLYLFAHTSIADTVRTVWHVRELVQYDYVLGQYVTPTVPTAFDITVEFPATVVGSTDYGTTTITYAGEIGDTTFASGLTQYIGADPYGDGLADQSAYTFPNVSDYITDFIEEFATQSNVYSPSGQKFWAYHIQVRAQKRMASRGGDGTADYAFTVPGILEFLDDIKDSPQSYQVYFNESWQHFDRDTSKSVGGVSWVSHSVQLVSVQVITDDDQLASMALKSSIAVGCKSVTGTVTLQNPAPAGGLVVALSDTMASAVTPATLSFLEGTISKTFTVKTVPIAASERGTVSASLGGRTLSQDLTVRPMGLSSVTLTPTSTVGGSQIGGKATLECAAGPGPIVVDLATSKSEVAGLVAASIVVPQGLKSGHFDVTTNPVLSKTTASISGAANGITKSKRLTVNVAASASPTSLRFGSVSAGNTSGALNSVLTNKGAVPIAVNSISLTGTFASWFAQTNNCPANLQAGASCTISVTFTPAAALSKSAKLGIATSATTTPLSVSLSGTGI